MARESLVVWIKPDGFYYVGDSCFWLTQPHPRLPKLKKCAGVTAVERDRRLELNLRLTQSVLHSPDYPIVTCAIEWFVSRSRASRITCSARSRSCCAELLHPRLIFRSNA